MDWIHIPFVFPEYYTAYCEYIENGEHKFIASDTPIYGREEAEEIATGYFDKPNVIRVWISHYSNYGTTIIPVRKKEKDNG